MLTLALKQLSPFSLSTDDTRKGKGRRGKGISLKMRDNLETGGTKVKYNPPLGGTGGGRESGPTGGWNEGRGGRGRETGRGFLRRRGGSGGGAGSGK